MPVINDLIAQLEEEDKRQRKEDDKFFAEQHRKYQELFEKKIEYFKEENDKYMSNIVKALEHLQANKHTIEKGLEQTENLTGLPIPHEQHGNIVDLFSKITGFINNVDSISTPSISPDKLHQDVVSTTDSVANDLKECHSEVVEAESLFRIIRTLNDLIRENDHEGEGFQNLDSSFL